MIKLISIFIITVLHIGLSVSGAAASDISAVDCVNTVGVKLFKSIRKSGINTCFSPLSIVSLFSTLSLGARGKTLQEMKDAFAFSDAIHESMRSLIYNVTNGPVDAGTLEMAHGVWPRKGFSLKERFIDDTKKYYDADVRTLDYAGSPIASAREINEWVSTKTHDKIQKMIDEKMLGSDTSIVLANTMYFLAPWAEEFSAKNTIQETFHKTSGDVCVPMMHNSVGAEIRHGRNYSSLKLLYAYGAYAMTIYLPDKDHDITAVQEEVMNEIVNRLSDTKPKQARVNVVLPKFNIDAEMDLKRPISEIGVGILLDPSSADLSGINGAHDLYVSDVLHHAVLEVSENGTEGAAATAIGLRTTSFLPEFETVEFRADRPFIFTIKDEISGTLIFLGTLEDPLE